MNWNPTRTFKVQNIKRPLYHAATLRLMESSATHFGGVLIILRPLVHFTYQKPLVYLNHRLHRVPFDIPTGVRADDQTGIRVPRPEGRAGREGQHGTAWDSRRGGAKGRTRLPWKGRPEGRTGKRGQGQETQLRLSSRVEERIGGERNFPNKKITLIFLGIFVVGGGGGGCRNREQEERQTCATLPPVPSFVSLYPPTILRVLLNILLRQKSRPPPPR